MESKSSSVVSKFFRSMILYSLFENIYVYKWCTFTVSYTYILALYGWICYIGAEDKPNQLVSTPKNIIYN